MPLVTHLNRRLQKLVPQNPKKKKKLHVRNISCHDTWSRLLRKKKHFPKRVISKHGGTWPLGKDSIGDYVMELFAHG